MANLNKKIGDSEPGILTVIVDPKTNDYVYLSINNNIIQLGDSRWSWDALEIPELYLYPIHNADDDTKYKVFTAHIIKAYYDANDEMAIFANYFKDPNNTKYKKEFDDLQELRNRAKSLAKHIVTNKLF